MICSITGCSKPVKHKGWCSAHYSRWVRHGDPTAGATSKGEPQRFYREVVLAYEGDDCLIWPFSRPNGYGRLWRDGRSQVVSRLVCEDAHGLPPTAKHDAVHSCNNGHLGCSTKRHISWGTRAENVAEAIASGTFHTGEKCYNSKLTEADVREIRSLRGSASQREIGARFGIDQSTVSDIQNRKKWAWLD